MTIDEAIAFERKLADYYKDNHLKNEAKEHEQLAEWLEELKFLRQWKSDVMDEFCKYDCNSVEEAWHYGYNKAIDDCKELTFREVVYYDSLNDRTEFRELAEQLKAGGDNEQR